MSHVPTSLISSQCASCDHWFSAQKDMDAHVLAEHNPADVGTCKICFETVRLHGLSCGHRYCKVCITRYLVGKVEAGQVSEEQLVCMEPYCHQPISKQDASRFLSKPILEKYKQFYFNQRVAKNENSFWCANPRCSGIIEITGRRKRTGTCKECGGKVCTSCRNPSHPFRTCRQASDRCVARWSRDSSLDVAQCPCCGVVIERTGGCDHMTCRECQHQFCWSCLLPWGWRSHNHLCYLLASPLGRSKARPIFRVAFIGLPCLIIGAAGLGAAVVAVAGAIVASPVVVPVLAIKHLNAKREQRRAATELQDMIDLSRGVEIVIGEEEGAGGVDDASTAMEQESGGEGSDQDGKQQALVAGSRYRQFLELLVRQHEESHQQHVGDGDGGAVGGGAEPSRVVPPEETPAVEERGEGNRVFTPAAGRWLLAPGPGVAEAAAYAAYFHVNGKSTLLYLRTAMSDPAIIPGAIISGGDGGRPVFRFHFVATSSSRGGGGGNDGDAVGAAGVAGGCSGEGRVDLEGGRYNMVRVLSEGEEERGLAFVQDFLDSRFARRFSLTNSPPN